MLRPINSIRKLSKVGRGESMAVVIPAEIIRSFRWRQHQRLIVKKIAGAVLIKDAKTRHRH